jgi:hypothetical protein
MDLTKLPTSVRESEGNLYNIVSGDPKEPELLREVSGTDEPTPRGWTTEAHRRTEYACTSQCLMLR